MWSVLQGGRDVLLDRGVLQGGRGVTGDRSQVISFCTSWWVAGGGAVRLQGGGVGGGRGEGRRRGDGGEEGALKRN